MRDAGNEEMKKEEVENVKTSDNFRFSPLK